MPVPTQSFKSWMNSNQKIRLSSDAAVNFIVSEGITTFASIHDFDRKSIQYLPGTCKVSISAIEADDLNNDEAEPSVNGENISTISARHLIVAVNAAKFYDTIRRLMTPQIIHYSNVLSYFKVECDDYKYSITQDDPKVPKVNDKEKDRKIIRWAPILLDYLSYTYESRGPLRYVLHDNTNVPGEDKYPLLLNNYYGQSGIILEDLIELLPYEGPIFNNDNATVYMMVDKVVQVSFVESTIKCYSYKKDVCSSFKALISNHAG